MSKTVATCIAETNQEQNKPQENVFFLTLSRKIEDFPNEFLRTARSTSPVQICAIFSTIGPDNLSAELNLELNAELEKIVDGWYRPKDTPEEYGFNAILLDELVNMKARNFRLQLKGDNLRYGFVGVTADGESLYSPVNATTFEVPAGKTLAHLYLIVMGAPMAHQRLYMPMGNERGTNVANTQFPYTFRLLN